MCRKISASVDGGQSGGSCVRRPGSKDPHRRERKFGIFTVLLNIYYFSFLIVLGLNNLVGNRGNVPKILTGKGLIASGKCLQWISCFNLPLGLFKEHCTVQDCEW